MEIQEIIIIVNAIISLVLLITFFVMASAVIEIKKQLVTKKEDPNTSLNLFYKYLSFNEKELAKKHLQDYIWAIIEGSQTNTFNTEKMRAERYQRTKERFHHLFKEVDSEFPVLIDKALIYK